MMGLSEDSPCPGKGVSNTFTLVHVLRFLSRSFPSIILGTPGSKAYLEKEAPESFLVCLPFATKTTPTMDLAALMILLLATYYGCFILLLTSLFLPTPPAPTQRPLLYFLSVLLLCYCHGYQESKITFYVYCVHFPPLLTVLLLILEVAPLPALFPLSCSVFLLCWLSVQAHPTSLHYCWRCKDPRSELATSSCI